MKTVTLHDHRGKDVVIVIDHIVFLRPLLDGEGAGETRISLSNGEWAIVKEAMEDIYRIFS